MGMMIYDKLTGEPRQCENVDAREILESAPELYSATPPDLTDQAGDDVGLTKAGIAADLEDMKVEFDGRASKATLMALRDEARAKRDAAQAEAQ